MRAPEEIPGYRFGSEAVAASPVSEEDLALLRQTLLWTAEDDHFLRLAGEVLADQVEDVLDVWYGFVGANDHLVLYFGGPDGRPDPRYLEAVRKRFGQWILDTCNRPYDRAWLDYQEEIAQRHHTSKKNQTDGVESVPYISLRYLVAFIFPITATMKEFLAKKGHDQHDVERMHQAWFKAVVLHVTLWTRPYVEGGLW
jgi:protoglobin